MKRTKKKFRITKEDIYKGNRKANREASIEDGSYMSNPPKITHSKKEYKRIKKHKKRYEVD